MGGRGRRRVARWNPSGVKPPEIPDQPGLCLPRRELGLPHSAHLKKRARSSEIRGSPRRWRSSGSIGSDPAQCFLPGLPRHSLVGRHCAATLDTAPNHQPPRARCPDSERGNGTDPWRHRRPCSPTLVFRRKRLSRFLQMPRLFERTRILDVKRPGPFNLIQTTIIP